MMFYKWNLPRNSSESMMYVSQTKNIFRFDLGSLTYLSKNLDTFDVAGFEFRQMGWNFQSQMCPQSPLVGVHTHTFPQGSP